MKTTNLLPGRSLMLSNLEVTLTELTHRFNARPTKANRLGIESVREEIARIKNGDL